MYKKMCDIIVSYKVQINQNYIINRSIFYPIVSWMEGHSRASALLGQFVSDARVAELLTLLLSDEDSDVWTDFVDAALVVVRCDVM